MENISLNLLIAGAIVSLTVIIVACIICYFKVKRIKFAQSHEKTMKELEFSQKQQWEELMAQNINDIQFAEEFDTYKKKVDDLETHSQNTTSLDMNKIAVLHLILSGNRGESDAESLKKEIKKVRESYKVIENYLKN